MIPSHGISLIYVCVYNILYIYIYKTSQNDWMQGLPWDSTWVFWIREKGLHARSHITLQHSISPIERLFWWNRTCFDIGVQGLIFSDHDDVSYLEWRLQDSWIHSSLREVTQILPGTMPPTSKIMLASGECGTEGPGGMPQLS